jgi:RND family efflux transporter MFP subunit
MNMFRKTIIGILISGISVSIINGCSNKGESGATIVERNIAIKGKEIVPLSKQLTRSYTGSLEGAKQADILAKISEAVEKIHVREGEFIHANDAIISLDRTGPTSSYMQSYSVYQNAEKNFNKMKYLYEEGAVSESQFDGAKTEYEVSKANYEAALQMVELRSPIAGTVTSIDVSVGEYVYPGMKVATVASTENLRMKLGVSGNDIGYFKEGAEVKITFEAESIFVGAGRVVMVARSADPVTRAFQIEVEVNNESQLFKPGMFAKAEITVSEYDNIIIAERQSIINRNDKNFIYIYSNGKAFEREVQLGVEFDGSSEIKSGLNVGDTLITVGQNYLRDGIPVKLARFVDATGKEVEF